MKNRYLKDNPVSKENIWSIIRYIGLEDFIFDAIRLQKFFAKYSSNKFYLYKFTCKSERNVFTDVFGQREATGPGTFVAHADDFRYLFTSKLLDMKIELDPQEFKMIEMVTTLWTNFAKYGNPTPDESLGARWKPYSAAGQEFLDIGERLTPGTAPEREDVEFWESIYAKYLPEHLP